MLRAFFHGEKKGFFFLLLSFLLVSKTNEKRNNIGRENLVKIFLNLPFFFCFTVSLIITLLFGFRICLRMTLAVSVSCFYEQITACYSNNLSF